MNSPRMPSPVPATAAPSTAAADDDSEAQWEELANADFDELVASIMSVLFTLCSPNC